MERKYKQRGYQDSGGSRERTERQPAKRPRKLWPENTQHAQQARSGALRLLRNPTAGRD
jgi:hypothetical protein